PSSARWRSATAGCPPSTERAARPPGLTERTKHALRPARRADEPADALFLPLEVLNPAAAVAEAVEVDIEQIQDAEQQATGRHRPLREREMPVALEPARSAPDQHVRHLVTRS